MSNYEFWDELGKIFNAVVAYQEKTIEFNKRFINPWIRLGNVFDKQDRNKEAVSAYQKAIEIDPENAQNWYELGNVYFKMASYEEAIDAFNRAIELNPDFGRAYNNLALTLVTQGKHVQAIPLYRKSIELLDDDKDKAVAWNRLGNLYRKLNEYALAVEAFQKADDLDHENAGFRDDLDEVPEAPTVIDIPTESDVQSATVTLDPIQLIVADSQAAEVAPESPAAVAESSEASTEVPTQPVAVEVGQAEAATGTPAPESQPVDEVAKTAEASAVSEATISVVVQTTIETFTETVAVPDTSTETSDVALTAEEPASQAAEAPVEVVEQTSDAQPVEAGPVAVADAPAEAVDSVAESVEAVAESTAPEADASSAVEPTVPVEEAPVTEAVSPVSEETADTQEEPQATTVEVPDQVAYEEFLKDNNQPVKVFEAEASETESEEPAASQEPVATIGPSGDLQIEMDTKNAHVWNELGNVYFNTGAYDDAIIAYSKAIELDRWFAWPYSNLALAYVQKARFAEAILLYQRSIELFTSEKDKAISWNRLGNVYRRMNDYENAIASYQRADDLDPDNTTLSLQSRFSLLGSYAVEPKPSYAA